MIQVVEKVLGRNELGHTGSHQSGVLIPKSGRLLEFFPPLPSEEELNPRRVIHFWNPETGRYWAFNYIHYNGRLHATSTRNEYRLTGTTPFFREVRAEVGDSLRFERSVAGYSVHLHKLTRADEIKSDGRFTLTLHGEWHYGTKVAE